MKIEINKDIQLILFDESLTKEFYDAIHAFKNESDVYRCNLQRKYDQYEKLEARIKDAIENKYKRDGTPDFFIYYQGNLAGIFEFYPLTPDDFIEIGYWLFSEFRRKGIISSVFPIMIDYAKNNFSKSKILATTPIDNIPSQKLLDHVQFQKTGKILELKQVDGEIVKEFEYIYLLS